MANDDLILTRGESHSAVLSLLDELPRGRILDMPAGKGGLAIKLLQMGFEVTAADIDPQLFVPTEIPCAYANLNEPLAMESDSFDTIACVAGIHRIHNFRGALLELARLLKPGGRLYVSFPNYTNIERRLEFLLKGSASRLVNRMGVHQHHTDEADAHFRQLLVYPQVEHAMVSAGLVVGRVVGDKLKRKSLFLLPLTVPIMIAGRLAGERPADGRCQRTMSSFTVLHGGNNLIVEARKP